MPRIQPFVYSNLPFEQAEPLPLMTDVAIAAYTDDGFFQALLNPYREAWGGGVVQNIFVDTINAEESIAIVNDTRSDVSVSGVNFDFSLFATDASPVLKPSTNCLQRAVVVVIALASRRRESDRPGVISVQV